MTAEGAFRRISIRSHAKINLFLRVFGKRADGYHAVQTLMLPIGLADEITLRPVSGRGIELRCSDLSLPAGRANLAWRAAELLQSRLHVRRGVRIFIRKRIPVGAGLGGGSSNASAVLVGLNRLWKLGLSEDRLERLAAELGSDTAFFIRNRPALCEGRGEILTPVSFRHPSRLFLLNFGFGSSTAWAYGHLDHDVQRGEAAGIDEALRRAVEAAGIGNWAGLLCSSLGFRNDLDAPVFRKFPILRMARDFLREQPGVIGAAMSGSGSTIFAALRSADAAKAVKSAVAERFGRTVWRWTGPTISSLP